MSKARIATIIVFALGWLNGWLVKNGHHPLPIISEGQAAFAVTFVVSVFAMLRENPFKRQKKPADEEPPAK